MFDSIRCNRYRNDMDWHSKKILVFIIKKYSANKILLEFRFVCNCLQFKSIKKAACIHIHTFFEPFEFLKNSSKLQTKILLGNDSMLKEISSNYFNVLRRIRCKRVKKRGEIKRLLRCFACVSVRVQPGRTQFKST